MRTFEERFWAKVRKSDGCWEWTASLNRQGYGRIKMPDQTTTAHRAAWIITHGPIPSGLGVLHHCDNPPCVRPDHLWLGTHLDNMRDMARKGRMVSGFAKIGYRGPRHWHTRLTEAQAGEVFARKVSGESAASLAVEYGITKSYVYDIVLGRSWRDANWRAEGRREIVIKGWQVAA